MREAPTPQPHAISGRLDKWLWHARVTRSRSGAQSLIVAGHVRVNRQRAARASHEVRIGDVLTIATGQRVRVLKISGFAPRRGPAAAARLLYEDLTTSGADRPAATGTASSGPEKK